MKVSAYLLSAPLHPDALREILCFSGAGMER